MSRPQGAQHYYGRPVHARQTRRAPVPPDPYYPGGDFGVEAQTSPVVPITTDGHVARHTHGPHFKPPRIEHVDSSRRNKEVYPHPTSFRLKFNKPLRGVHSIELLDIAFPNVVPSAYEPAGGYVLVLNGIVDKSSGFQQQSDSNLGALSEMIAHDSGDVNSRSEESTKFPFSEYALAKIYYDPFRPVQIWERHDFRKIKYFTPPQDRLTHIDFSLTDRDGNLYPMEKNDDWTCTLQIVCKQ